MALEVLAAIGSSPRMGFKREYDPTRLVALGGWYEPGDAELRKGEAVWHVAFVGDLH